MAAIGGGIKRPYHRSGRFSTETCYSTPTKALSEDLRGGEVGDEHRWTILTGGMACERTRARSEGRQIRLQATP
jgi:hypothetical protein